jgi:hypothetical protein
MLLTIFIGTLIFALFTLFLFRKRIKPVTTQQPVAPVANTSTQQTRLVRIFGHLYAIIDSNNNIDEIVGHPVFPCYPLLCNTHARLRQQARNEAL